MLVSELASGLIAGSISYGDRSSGARASKLASLSDLAQPGEDAVFVLEENLRSDFEGSLDSLWQDFAQRGSTLVILAPRRASPQVDPQFDEPVCSFLCSADVFREYVALQIDCRPQTTCFALLRAIAKNALKVDRLLVRQLPYHQVRKAPLHLPPFSVLMPHRGDRRYLETALHYLLHGANNGVRVRVGLDGEDAPAYDDLAHRYAAAEFFRFHPAPVGPYVIRQALAEASTEPWLSLQDSDDISCSDRFPLLLDAISQNGCGIVGSHELCLDEIRAVVTPVRYPVDSSAALALRPNHALLHATLLAHRSAFFESGGLSTHHIIANDTQFLLRLFFTTSIRNVDEFLYIRRRHKNSLTNAPETVFDNPLRRKLNAEWTADFEAVKHGRLKLEHSSLRPMHRSEPYHVERLSP